ncbi:LptF/LptG family permease [Botrimarina mediterranea]|uniref:Putative permease YjgP/YjgQ family protein n=1 Tax=Botrimarina mediterranea TaxID=2528022 RepID=A0A518K4F6_9BACT|nr:LptF/LptG family permease [Botrimarina mediterranea]QDV72679.1 putative permease YjgP/YjgQ family protein [Botrimarina mediterranea]QDV77251.1 putative permease YjgP/YjgQ family protein [Planctomycetes bacterium K2D]
MRKIDFYLLRQFVQVFVICFVSLAGLYTVIDAFGRLDDFSQGGASLGDAALAAGRYYALQSLGFFNKTSGILTLIAAMFTVTWIQRHNEMTALLAAGVPRLKVLLPVIIASVSIAFGAAGLREFVLPSIRHELSLDSKDLNGERGVELKPRYDNVTDILLGGETANLSKRTIENVNFTLPPRLSGPYGKQILAKNAAYLQAEGDRPGGYLLTDVTRPAQIDTQSMLADDKGAIVVTRRDAPWLQPGQAFVVSGVSFDLLAQGSQWRDLASTSELVRELANPSTDLGPDVRVAVHSRLAQPFLDVTLLLIGLPLVVSRGSGNPFVAIGLCVAVVTAFFVLTLGGQALGGGGWLKPALGAWLPLIAFVPVAAYQFDSLRQ